MKIKIIKCSSKIYWYKNYIGETYEVNSNRFYDKLDESYNYEIKAGNFTGNLILISDCEIISLKQGNKPSFEELQQAAQPLVDILYKYYDPHSIIIIEQDCIKILCGDIIAPIELRD
jgi:hypothetical protein